MYSRCVICEHQEGADWALVLVADRNQYGRRSITPMVFANDGCGILAVAPQLKAWVRAGLVVVYSPPLERREELLKYAVQEFVRAVSLRTNILERSRVGIVARAKARSEQVVPPQGFEISEATEPAFWWLASRSETAGQALKVLSYLIGKNKLGDLTQAERTARRKTHQTRGARTCHLSTTLRTYFNRRRRRHKPSSSQAWTHMVSCRKDFSGSKLPVGRRRSATKGTLSALTAERPS